MRRENEINRRWILGNPSLNIVMWIDMMKGTLIAIDIFGYFVFVAHTCRLSIGKEINKIVDTWRLHMLA